MGELNPVFGKQKFLLFRLLKEAGTKAAAKLALQMEHTFNYERETESTQTKDGSVTSSGGMEVTLDITAVSSRDDVNKMLFDAVVNDEVLEVWEVDTGAPASGGKYKAKYARGRLNKWELPSAVDGVVEVSTSMSIDGVPVDGEVTLTDEQKLLIKAAYEFKDITAG
ncbi:phage major tail protein, TP901-1 family [Aerococcaceae bacterium NML130460]|nr:phage major tail protein, TP901-1 family [Aerococcaceae bacterium NML130460]